MTDFNLDTTTQYLKDNIDLLLPYIPGVTSMFLATDTTNGYFQAAYWGRPPFLESKPNVATLSQGDVVVFITRLVNILGLADERQVWHYNNALLKLAHIPHELEIRYVDLSLTRVILTDEEDAQFMVHVTVLLESSSSFNTTPSRPVSEKRTAKLYIPITEMPFTDPLPVAVAERLAQLVLDTHSHFLPTDQQHGGYSFRKTTTDVHKHPSEFSRYPTWGELTHPHEDIVQQLTNCFQSESMCVTLMPYRFSVDNHTRTPQALTTERQEYAMEPFHRNTPLDYPTPVEHDVDHELLDRLEEMWDAVGIAMPVKWTLRGEDMSEDFRLRDNGVLQAMFKEIRELSRKAFFVGGELNGSAITDMNQRSADRDSGIMVTNNGGLYRPDHGAANMHFHTRYGNLPF